MQNMSLANNERTKKLVVLKFKSMVHFGRNKDSDLTKSGFWCTSDQLFSAIVNVFYLVYGKTEADAFMAEFQTDKPPLIVSSTFLTIGKPNPVYFLPKPLNVSLAKYFDDEKKARKIAYVPYEVLMTLAKNEVDVNELNAKYKPQGLFLVPQDWKKELFAEIERPRVLLDNITAASNIYYMSVVEYADGVGLYFMMDCKTEWLAKIKTVLRVLGEEGLGGERTYGLGVFKVEDFREPLAWGINGNDTLLLSAYYPSDSELGGLSDNISEYQLREVGGYIYSAGDKGFRKKQVRVFGEGSVFALNPVGQMLDITPEGFNAHRVYRNCLAYTLPWNLAKGG